MLQWVTLGIQAQNRNMFCDSVVQQNHVNIMMKRLFLLKPSCLPFQPRREVNDADRFEGSLSLRKSCMTAKRRPDIRETNIFWNPSLFQFGHGDTTSLGTGRVKCFT